MFLFLFVVVSGMLILVFELVGLGLVALGLAALGLVT